MSSVRCSSDAVWPFARPKVSVTCAEMTVPETSGVSDVMPSDAVAVPPDGGNVDGDIEPAAVAVAGSAVIATPFSGIPASAATSGGSTVSATTSAYAPLAEIGKLAAPFAIDTDGETTS